MTVLLQAGFTQECDSVTIKTLLFLFVCPPTATSIYFQESLNSAGDKWRHSADILNSSSAKPIMSKVSEYVLKCQRSKPNRQTTNGRRLSPSYCRVVPQILKLGVHWTDSTNDLTVAKHHRDSDWPWYDMTYIRPAKKAAAWLELAGSWNFFSVSVSPYQTSNSCLQCFSTCRHQTQSLM